MSFVNRGNVVQEVAFKLAYNAKQPTLPPHNSNRQLIVLCNFFGFGKTRFAQEFLPKLNQHKNHPNFYDYSHPKIEYENEIENISKMILFEVPCDKITYPVQRITMDVMKATFYDYTIGLLAQFSKIETPEHKILDSTEIKKEIEKIDKELNTMQQRKSEFDINIQNLAYFLKSHRILLFLDEISVLATKLQIQGTLLEKMYHVWKEILTPFVSYGGLICAGKGIFLKALGEGRLSSINQRTKVSHPQFKGFPPENIKQVMKETKFLKPIHDYLEKIQLLESFVNDVAQKTGGIPIFFEYVLRELASKYKILRAASSLHEKREFLKKIIVAGDNFPERADKFFKNADEIYKVLHAYGLFLAAFEIEIEEGESVKLPKTIKSTMFSEYEWKQIKIEDIVNQLDCYFVDTGKIDSSGRKKMKILFPPMIVEKRFQQLQQQPEPLIPFFSHVIKTGIKDITDVGVLLEYMVNAVVTWKINYQMFGNNSKTFQEIFPFLKDSFIGDMKLTQRIPDTAFNIPKLVSKYGFRKDIKRRNLERKDQEFKSIQSIIQSCQKDKVSNVHIDNWYAILQHCPENQILKPGLMSHSADSLLVVEKYKHILLFQDKNTTLNSSVLVDEILKVDCMIQAIKKVEEQISSKSEQILKNQEKIEKNKQSIEEMKNVPRKKKEQQRPIEKIAQENDVLQKMNEALQAETAQLKKRQEISQKFSNLKMTLVVVALKFESTLQKKISEAGTTIKLKSTDCISFFDTFDREIQFSDDLEVIILNRNDLNQFLHQVNVEILEKFSETKKFQNFSVTAQKVVESLEYLLPPPPPPPPPVQNSLNFLFLFLCSLILKF